jgi:hypothetical protein
MKIADRTIKTLSDPGWTMNRPRKTSAKLMRRPLRGAGEE